MKPGSYTVSPVVDTSEICGSNSEDLEIEVEDTTDQDFLLKATTCGAVFVGGVDIHPFTNYSCNNNAPYTTPCQQQIWNFCSTIENIGPDNFTNNPIIHLGVGSPSAQVLSSTVTCTGPNPQMGWIMSIWSYLLLGNNGRQFEKIPATRNWLAYEQCTFCIDVLFTGTGNLPAFNFYRDVGQIACDPFIANGYSETIPFSSNCSCDPNNIVGLPAGCGDFGYITNQKISYTVNFENIGMGPAKKIIIRDTLDADFDTLTIVIDSSSHIITDTIITDSTIIIEFDTIWLPSTTYDPINGKGWVAFSATPKSGLADHTQILNRAAIIFDSNAEILTNETRHTIFANPGPEPDLGGDELVYFGYEPEECVTLQPTVSGGVSPYDYLWFTGNSADTLDSLVVCPVDTTEYIVQVVDSVGCYGFDTIKVNVIDTRCGADSNKVYNCKGGVPICIDSIDVEDSLSAGWSLGPCPASKWEEVDLTSQQVVILVYPNPFEKSVHFEFQSVIDQQIELQLFDINGKLLKDIYNNEVRKGCVKVVELDASELPAGLYIYKLKGEFGYLKTGKIVHFE